MAAPLRVRQVEHYASLCGDWERLLTMHVQRGQPLRALQALA
jgi:hypothetical protein